MPGKGSMLSPVLATASATKKSSLVNSRGDANKGNASTTRTASAAAAGGRRNDKKNSIEDFFVSARSDTWTLVRCWRADDFACSNSALYGFRVPGSDVFRDRGAGIGISGDRSSRERGAWNAPSTGSRRDDLSIPGYPSELPIVVCSATTTDHILFPGANHAHLHVMMLFTIPNNDPNPRPLLTTFSPPFVQQRGIAASDVQNGKGRISARLSSLPLFCPASFPCASLRSPADDAPLSYLSRPCLRPRLPDVSASALVISSF